MPVMGPHHDKARVHDIYEGTVSLLQGRGLLNMRSGSIITKQLKQDEKKALKKLKEVINELVKLDEYDSF
jgi:fatty acid-binding protein DegV